MKKYLPVLGVFLFAAISSGCSHQVPKGSGHASVESSIESSAKSVDSRSINTQQIVEHGIVQYVNIIPLHDNAPSAPFGNVGVSIGSGGHHGIFGAIDVGSLIKVLSKANQAKTVQEIIVKKANGQTVAITQSAKDKFKKGDSVKVLLRDGKAVVVR